MYKCTECGACFGVPDKEENPFCGGVLLSCPYCGSDEFIEQKECERCGALTDGDGPDLCPECRAALLILVNSLFDQLTTAQLNQFDAWMDGSSIFDREEWS